MSDQKYRLARCKESDSDERSYGDQSCHERFAIPNSLSQPTSQEQTNDLSGQCTIDEGALPRSTDLIVAIGLSCPEMLQEGV